MKKRILPKRRVLVIFVTLLLLLISSVYLTFFKKPNPFPGDSNQPYWKIRLYKDQSYVFFRDLFKQDSSLNKTIKNVVQIPKQDKKFTSKLADFTLRIPTENYSEIEQKPDYEYLVMWITPDDYNKDGEEKLLLAIYPVSKGCKDTNKIPANSPTKINFAGKYPMSLIHGSISHGDSGHYYNGVTELDNGYCIDLSIKYDRKYEERFLKIIEGK